MSEKLSADLNIIQSAPIELELLDGDLNIIQKLDDEPNDVGGLTSAELKAKFDESGNIIKKYINETLIPAVLAEDATEESRKQAEAARVAAEQVRQTNEETRKSNEAARVTAEGNRATAEGARANAETARVQNETERKTSEASRASAETARANAETQRAANETARQQAETQRQSAENARNVWEDYSASKAYAVGNKVAYGGSSYLCIKPCTGIAPPSAEYWRLIAAKGGKGDTGAQGPQGVQGPRGETGPANTLKIGTVTSGSEASATITGTAPDQTLDLVLPKGDKGDTGPQGPQGPIGDTTKACLVTLKSSSWDSGANTQTVTVDGILADEATQRVLALPAVASAAAYRDAGICMTARENGTVTFSAKTVPSANLKVWVSWENVEDVTHPPIYGVEWDGTATTAWSRTDDAAGFADPVAAVNNGNGSSPFDSCMPWSGMVVVDDATCGKLVKIPKYWYRWTKTGNQMKLQISDAAQTGFLVSPAHADRGDGKGERDYVYVGRYHCASTYKSTSGVKPVGNITRAAARSSIHALGSDVWQYDFAMYWTIMMLYLVEYADWNSQAKIGYGCGNNSGTENMGATDAMTYHTGTTAASRTTYAAGVQYRHIEGLWSNVYDWCDGIYFSGANVYCIKNPASFSDTSGGTNIGTRPTSGDWISAWSISSVSGFEYALYPSAVAGSENTYVCDYCDYNASGVVLFVGGNYYQDQYHGAFCLFGNHAASFADASFGCRLQKLP